MVERVCVWELTLAGFTVKCTVTADCSKCPSVCLSVVSVSTLSLSLFISPSLPDQPFLSPDLSLLSLTSAVCLSATS